MAVPGEIPPREATPAVATSPPTLTERPRLRALFLKALRRRLVLVIAPTGFGKTLALRDAAKHCGVPVVWIDLSHGTPSLRALAGRIATEFARTAGVEPPRPTENDRPHSAWFGDAAALAKKRFPSGLWVVLDAVEQTPQPDEIAALAIEFLAATPPAVGLALTGTALPLVRLDSLARTGQLAIIGPEHLAFTPDEVREAMRAWGTGLNDELIYAVERVTSGWPRGVAGIAAAYPAAPTADDLMRASKSGAFHPPTGDPPLPPDAVDRELVLALSSLPYIELGDVETLTGVHGAHQRVRRLAQEGTVVKLLGADRYTVDEEVRTRLAFVLAVEWRMERLTDHWARVGRIMEGRGDVEDALRAYLKGNDDDGVSRALRLIGLSSLMDQDPASTIALAEDLTRRKALCENGELLQAFVAMITGEYGHRGDIGVEAAPQGQRVNATPEARRLLADRLPSEASLWPRVWETWHLLERGDLREAARLISGSKGFRDAPPGGFHAGWALVCRARLHCGRGEYGAARAALERVAPGENAPFLRVLRDRWTAEIDAREGDFLAASQRARDALPRAGLLEATALLRELWGLATLCAVWRGDPDEARALAAQAEAEGMGSIRIAHARAMMSRQWPAAHSVIQDVQASGIDQDEWSPWSRLLMGFLALREGLVESARETLTAVLDHAQGQLAEHLKTNALLCLAYAESARGDDGGSGECLRRFWESVASSGFRFMPVSDSDMVLWAERAAASWLPRRRTPVRRLIAAETARGDLRGGEEAAKRVEVITLGQFGLRVPGEIGDEPWKSGRKAKRLFQLLLASPSHRVSLDAAADALWPHGDPGKITHSLHNEVSNLRRILAACGMGNDIEVRAEHGSYRLYCSQDVCIVDRAFEETATRGLAAADAGRHDEARTLLEAAVEMYKGAFLEDAPYESFVEARRAGLAQTMGACLHALASQPCAMPEDAEKYWQRALEVDPWDEGAYRGIAELCVQRGHHGKARQYLNEMQRKIVQELAVPMPEWARALDALMLK